MRFFRGLTKIRNKMLLLFIPIIVISIICITSIILIDVNKSTTNLLRGSAEQQLNLINEDIQGELAAHQKIAETLSTIAGQQGNSMKKDDYVAIMKELITKNKNTYGVGIWFEPYMYNKDKKYFGPYVYKDNDKLVYTEEYEDPTYDYFQFDWYKDALASNHGIIWSPPFYDEILKTTLISATIPFYQNGKAIGVISADYDIKTIQKLVLDQKFLKSGFAVLVDKQGQFIAHKDEEIMMKQNINENMSFKMAESEIMNNVKGATSISVDKNENEVFFDTIPNTFWKIMLIEPTNELFHGLNLLIIKSISISIIALLVLVLTIFVFSGRLTKNIKLFVDAIEHLSKGDLTQVVTVSGKDEFSVMGNYYNEALVKLGNMIKNILSNSESVASSAEELSASVEETNKAISQVACSMQSVSDNSHEQNEFSSKLASTANIINDKMLNIFNNIEVAKESANKTSTLATEGNIFVNEVVSQMNKINTQVTESSYTINELNEKSKKIEEIITMISDIAGKTNLLSLNAAIEAARAGEHGKGFAVVADEVRKLADASSKASGDISTLIQEIQLDIIKSVNSMESSNNATKSGLQIAEQTGQAFLNISTSIDDVNHNTQEVYNAISLIIEETNQMKELVEAVSDIAASNHDNTLDVSANTQQQTSIMQEVASAIEELAVMSTNLQKEVSIFNV